MIGSLIFSMIKTRPNIAFLTFITSCFAKNSGYQYIKIVKITLQYLKSSKEQGITYRS